jgi:hypothetical protein
MPTIDDAATRHVARVAQEAAWRLGHAWIGAEHLLFAASAGLDPTGETLRAAGLSPRPMWKLIEQLVGVGRWAVDRDALAAIGIDVDEVLSAAGVPSGSPSIRNSGRRPRRHRHHLPLNAVATRCLLAAVTPGGRSTSMTGTAVVAEAIIHDDSRTVELLLQRCRVDTAGLSLALRRIMGM